ncbi:DUF6776 family protein [Cognatilysobacter bugurensis]|uniref:Uncharacterized protein n=1 Tax=Cognatilysobacter bugurensis TaxID=543356 RepID=A0A918SZD6_9GAMM|nr:DUF6776 family protein [Lysobacter bugurensis]GHA80107.1 hypothetical protein GCM10007067_17210 [Lysobacter bugurensis]
MTHTSDDSAPRRARPSLQAALIALAFAFGLWGLWQTFGTDAAGARRDRDDARAALRTQGAELETLRQQVATLRRSDQISRDANRDLQTALAERDEELAGLRADVAFYERLVGATSQRRGLSVHALRMQPQNGHAWHFTSTLTQNLNRGAVSHGRLTLAIEGTRGGRLETLSWADLRQQPSAPAVDYSFRYFQQVEGDVVLPDGFEPVRVTVRLVPRSGAAIEESFTWREATGEGAEPRPAS